MSGAAPTEPISEQFEPRRAVVVPRGRRVDCSASLPLEQLIFPLIESKANGIVRLSAPPGGGKTTAIRHLQATLPTDLRIHLLDELTPHSQPPANGLSILATAVADRTFSILDEFQICPWTLEDCMEYLCIMHREQCAAILTRLRAESAVERFDGSPQLLTMAMDAMASHPLVPTFRAAVCATVLKIVPRGTIHDTPFDSLPIGLDVEQRRWWRHEVIRNILRADWTVEELCAGRLPAMLNDRAFPELFAEIVAAASDRPAACARLDQVVREDPMSGRVPTAASLLVRVDPNWRPETGRNLNLLNADLHEAKWPRIDLQQSTLTGADFKGADLTQADLLNVDAMADFTAASLRGARLARARLQKSCLRCADLSRVNATFANLSDTDLEAVDLTEANLSDAQIVNANLDSAVCKRANFTRAKLNRTILDRADFSGATFYCAALDQLDMSTADWTGATFVNASLSRCNLEGLNLPGPNFEFADLTGSLFTGSFMPDGNFHGADLRKTGLADVDWEHADLRDADFTDASFHMGSTRSGLVGSTIAGEGSRTGFYTDDFTEMNFKSPEEIRKANLRGADLTGAKVTGTDFYLVDLRGAIYSPDQAEHFRGCGAILTT